jgi:hypothetical protein
MKKIAFIIPYFGKWPEWMKLYVDSIERNKTIDFHFITDCDTAISQASNIYFHQSTFEEYVRNAQHKLGVTITIPNPYKICDLRPFFGVIHAYIIEGYDFFGWTDVDILFGDIRSFYTEEVFANHDVLSSHAIRLAGHCALLKNTEEFRNMGYKIYNWQEALNNPNFVGIDEHGMTNALCMTFWDRLSEKLRMRWIASLFRWKRKQKMKRYYFVEQYSTPFTTIPWLDGSINSEQPDEWYYDKGTIRNNRDDRDFMYIHFMNFKSSQWRHDGTKAPWEGKEIIFKRVIDKPLGGIVINAKGISNE